MPEMLFLLLSIKQNNSMFTQCNFEWSFFWRILCIKKRIKCAHDACHLLQWEIDIFVTVYWEKMRSIKKEKSHFLTIFSPV